jgi:hypothetical protein
LLFVFTTVLIVNIARHFDEVMFCSGIQEKPEAPAIAAYLQSDVFFTSDSQQLDRM